MLVLIAQGCGHGYALSLRLHAMGVAPAGLDVGELYRTLRDLEGSDFVRSAWTTREGGPRRREYVLTELGAARLAEWAGVMGERARLVGEFLTLFDATRSGATQASRDGATQASRAGATQASRDGPNG